MDDFFLKQLNFNRNIFLKNISVYFNIDLEILLKQYNLDTLSQNINLKTKPLKIYKNLYKNIDGHYYMVLRGKKLNFNAIKIN